jgi:hypothetical protein
MKKYKEKHLIGTSPSIDMVLKLMKDFYCGCEQTIKETSCKNVYDVVDEQGKILDGVFVHKKGKRFRFSIKEL